MSAMVIFEEDRFPGKYPLGKQGLEGGVCVRIVDLVSGHSAPRLSVSALDDCSS